MKFGTGENFLAGQYKLKDNIKSGEYRKTAQKSDPLLVSDKEQSEEEVIEEDIQHSHENNTPLINAQTKQINGKAKALYPAHAPPVFQSTESGRLKLDTMTGFKQTEGKSPLGRKPFLGGRPPLKKNRESPDPHKNSFIEIGDASPYGNNMQGQMEIEEEI
jgi:hypothetical protein